VDVATYLRGVGLLILAVVPLVVGARRVRTRLVPRLSGAAAALSASVLFVGLLLATLQATGAVGLLRPAPVVIACVAVGSAAAAWGRRRPDVLIVDDVPAERIGRSWVIVTVLVVGVVGGIWCAGTAASVGRGILDFDSLNYHLPFAAQFAQQGHVLPLHYASPGSETPFDPANSELVHAFGMVLFRRDLLSPFVNLGWLALALLAAWCVGRRWGLGTVTLAAVAVLLASPLMVSADAGTAKNDIVDVCMLLAAVALLLHADDGGGRLRLGTVTIAGIAAGIGVGNKLSLFAPVLALTVGVVLAARRPGRLAATSAWLGALTVAGAFWYVRNLVVVGNPVPTLHLGVGGYRLPAPDLSIVRRTGFTVAHYLGDAHVWRTFFLPGLRADLGWSWPLVLALAVAGTIAMLRRGTGLLRWLGLAAALSGVAYLVTPESASGPAGHPDLFSNNLRYAFPALTLALVVGALALAIGSRRPTGFVVGVLAVAIAGEQTVWLEGADISWSRAVGPVVAGVAAPVVIAIVALLVSRRMAPARPPSNASRLAALGVLGVMAVIGIGAVRPLYFDHRYRDLAQWDGGRHLQALQAVYRWAATVHHARIAVGDLDEQYPLYGADLSNAVQYVGSHTAHHGFERAPTCQAWRRAVAAGRFTYIVTAKDRAPGEPNEGRWTVGDPAVSEILHVGSARVFRVSGVLDASRCP
jgi:hypothetical protein